MVLYLAERFRNNKIKMVPENMKMNTKNRGERYKNIILKEQKFGMERYFFLYLVKLFDFLVI